MAFTDDFTGADDTTLGSRAGWTQLQGSVDEATIQNNTLARETTTGGRLFYATGDDGAAAQTVKIDNLPPIQMGLVVYGTVANGLLSGYYLRVQSGSSSVRLWRMSGDSATFLTASTSIPDAVGIEIRVSLNQSGDPVISAYRQGVQIATYTDSSAEKLTSGRRGIAFITTNTASGADNYSDNYSAVAQGGVTLSITERANGFVWEGVRASSAVLVEGTYTESPEAIQARVLNINGNPVPGYGWSTLDASPADDEFSGYITNLPVGGPYTLEVRADGDDETITTAINKFYVGAVVLLWGQSQCARLGSVGPGTVSATANMPISYLTPADRTQPSSIDLFDVSTGAAQIGSGIVAMANQWHADAPTVPLMIVDVNYEGTSIALWIADGQRPAMQAGWNLWSGLASAMFDACAYQASAVMFMQGTADANNPPAQYKSDMATLRTMFEDALPDMVPLFPVVPHQRSCDGPNTERIRQAQFEVASSGAPWSICAWLLDWEMVANADPHQSANPAGNARGGTRIGRGLAKQLANSNLDRDGPRLTRALLGGGGTTITLSFDRDVTAPSGATTGIKGIFVAADGTNFDLESDDHAAEITGARTIVLTKNSGTWTTATRVDFGRGVPYSSDSGQTFYVAPENTLEANYFSKSPTDTSSFDGGRGMPPAPYMGAGYAVVDDVVSPLPDTPPIRIAAVSGFGGNREAFAQDGDVAAAWTEPMDPGESLDYRMKFAEGASPLLEDGELIETYTIALSPQAIALGLTIESSAPKEPQLVNGNEIALWFSIEPEFRSDPAFDGGITFTMTVTIVTDANPSRTRERTFSLTVKQL